MFVSIPLLCILLVPISWALIGLDVSQRVSPEQFQCLKDYGYELVIVRLYRSVGVVDWQAAQIIRNARIIGFERIEAYFLPCQSCGDPEQQMVEALEYLKDENVDIDRLWINVGGRWTNSTEMNEAFLEVLIQSTHSYEVDVGISTTRFQWKRIMNDSTKFSANIPLWYANDDDQKSFDDFQGFAGWNEPRMKQYRLDVKECGVVCDRNFA